MNRKFFLNNDDESVRFLDTRFHCANPKVFAPEKKQNKLMNMAIIFSLLLCIGVFQGWKRFEKGGGAAPQKLDIVISVEDIPQTVQKPRTVAPARPAMPIESEDENMSEDETIADTEIDLNDLPPPPPPPAKPQDESGEIFIAYDEPPTPIGGFAAIQNNLEYPELARRVGVEGKVILRALIDEKGQVKDVEVLQTFKGEVSKMFDEAAIKAIRSVKWNPAKQRDKKVSVWVAIPVTFVLE